MSEHSFNLSENSYELTLGGRDNDGGSQRGLDVRRLGHGGRGGLRAAGRHRGALRVLVEDVAESHGLARPPVLVHQILQGDRVVP